MNDIPDFNDLLQPEIDDIDLSSIDLSDMDSISIDHAQRLDLSINKEKDQQAPGVTALETTEDDMPSKPETNHDVIFLPGTTQIHVDKKSEKISQSQPSPRGLYNLPHRFEFPENINEIFEAQLQGKPAPTAAQNVVIRETLSDYLDKMPHGIVDKQIAGIGATTLEIESKRDSIIVVPTKILAYNKWIKHKAATLYIGGRINQERGATSNKEIQDYIKNNNITYKKFLVVADSLYRLLRNIGEDNFKDYFLMIDEVDMLQSESNYRPKLESLIDYYFMFPTANRSLVTATLRAFTHPQL